MGFEIRVAEEVVTVMLLVWLCAIRNYPSRDSDPVTSRDTPQIANSLHPAWIDTARNEQSECLFFVIWVNWPFSMCHIKWAHSPSLHFCELIKAWEQHGGDKDRMDWVLDCQWAQDLHEFDLWPEVGGWRPGGGASQGGLIEFRPEFDPGTFHEEKC